MSKPCPPCLNSSCPSYKSNQAVIVLRETSQDVTFGCKTCGGVHVRTLDWRRGAQERIYQQYGRPEYARNKSFFFQGKNKLDRSY